ncbi:hypothetical protein L150_03302 [Candida albicans Ca529L]|nr:hypothetical protein L150_03302 [Candida albicans Ca529L]
MNKYLATQKSWLIWKNYITTAVCWENMNQKCRKVSGLVTKMQYQLLLEQVVPQSGMQRSLKVCQIIG